VANASKSAKQTDLKTLFSLNAGLNLNPANILLKTILTEKQETVFKSRLKLARLTALGYQELSNQQVNNLRYSSVSGVNKQINNN
jgi:hypothetical protein